MFGEYEVRELVDDLFEEEALVIGGMVAAYEMDDDLVRRLMSSLDVIRKKVLLRIETQEDGSEPKLNRSSFDPHPAIEEFLLSLRGV